MTAAKAAAPRPAISMRWRARRSLVRDSGTAMRGRDASPSRTIASPSSATRSGWIARAAFAAVVPSTAPEWVFVP
jgi:hypothetical protein